MTPRAIEVKGLHKSYGDVEAVRGVDLHVDVGEVFALLGPNGAGKTTTVEVLEGHRRRNSGEVDVLGYDPGKGQRAYKERIGIVLQETGVEPFLTVAEVVELYCGYYPRPRPVDEIIELVGLQEKRDARVNKLSGGQRRRLDVAVGLAGDPDLLFLDEPTTGFDPSARRNAWQVIRNLVDIGKTVFLTTHYMDEAQTLADRVAIIVNGKIVAEGPPDSLQAGRTTATAIEFGLPAGPQLPPALAQLASTAEGRYHLSTNEPMRTLHELTGWALENDTELEGLSVSRPSLEDVYLQLTAATDEGPTE